MREAEIAENNARILAGVTVQHRYRPEAVQQGQQKAASVEKLSADARRLLMAILTYQYRRTKTEIADVVGFSAGKHMPLFKALERTQLIRMVEIVRGKGVSKFPVLLSEAYKVLDLEEPKFQGKGCGEAHLVWQHLVAEHFSEQKPAIELNKNGKFIDVGIERDGILLAIEVAMTAEHEKANLLRDVEIAKASIVITGCKDEKVREEVIKEIAGLPEEVRQKARVYLLREILENSMEQLIGGGTR